jgi:hypothetical protein
MMGTPVHFGMMLGMPFGHVLGLIMLFGAVWFVAMTVGLPLYLAWRG